MSLDSSLSVASGALANINRHLAVVSQNVANVGTPGYAREVMRQTSATAEGQGMGVRSGLVVRELDTHLQAAALRQNGEVAGLEVRSRALAGIAAAHGTTGAGGDLASLVGRLQDSFTSLAADPSSTPQQAAVVGAARGLALQVNTLSADIAATRQSAQDGLVADVGTLNATLATLGRLSDRIIQLRADGRSTADLENQRDAARATLSRLLDTSTIDQPNGDLLVFTPSGLSLPIHGDDAPFALDAASLDAQAWYPGGGVPALTLRGSDVTGQLRGGTLGANIALRDTTLPTFQAELDEFAQTLSQRFDAQGLRLFTDPSGAVPVGGVPVQDGYVGYAGIIQVNPDIAADPRLVRDGTHAVADTPGGPTAFTPNPVGGPAGFATLIARVLDFSFTGQVRSGVTQPIPAGSGLGPGGTLAAPYAAPVAIGALASTLVASQADAGGRASEALAGATSLQTALSDKLAASSAVSIDTEMTTMLQLQGAYAANARIISTVQAMWTQTLQMVQ